MITVEIRGPAGTGKTGVARLIRDALETAGIDVSINESLISELSNAELEGAISPLSRVELATHQERR